MFIPNALYGGVTAFVQTLELKSHRLLHYTQWPSDLSDRKKVFTKLTVMCYHIVLKSETHRYAETMTKQLNNAPASKTDTLR